MILKDNMISTNFLAPQEVKREIAKKAQEKRLSLNLSQQSLSVRSGVSMGTLKRFERTGKISLEALLKLAMVLDSLTDFTELFKPSPTIAPSLDALLNKKIRKRGRR